MGSILSVTERMPRFLVLLLVAPCIFADYWTDRNRILANEASKLLGSSIDLTEQEQKVNDILMTLKRKEYDQGFAGSSTFPPSVHFFRSKAAIDQSEVFKFIQKVPKGASLHSHFSAMLSLDALMDLTYMEGLYGCDNEGTFQLQFFVGDVSEECQWLLLDEWRNANETFDDYLKDKLTLVVDNPEEAYSDIDTVWTVFEDIFDLVSPLFWYQPFMKQYLYQVFQEFYDDNVRYMEIRGSVGESYDANNTLHSSSETAQLYLDTLSDFQKDHPDFLGLRLIYAKGRNIDNKTLADHIDSYFQLRDQHPHLIAGFDLVGQEDLGEPLSAFADQLLAISNKTDFFFHAGETNWYGTTDLNLIDAILLNTSRIGHAFAIVKHPEALRLVKEKGIAIELNPLSNQVLKLVDDLRNHVGAYLIGNGYNVVVSCDDPTFWGAKGLSYDWYMAFMGMTPRNGDLRILKQLAMNSLMYSSLGDSDVTYVLALWQRWWDDFIQEILDTYQ